MKQFKSVLTLLLALAMLLTCAAPGFAADCAHANTIVRNAVAAGCVTEGYSGDLYCADCGVLLRSGAVIAPTGHHYDDGVVSQAPTCTEDGVRTYLCKDCGDMYTTVIKAYGHIFDEWVVKTPATATMKGEETRTCFICGATESRDIKPLGYDRCYARYYTDCPDKWYHEAVDFMVDACLMDGISTKEFAPNGTMTRAMMVTVLYRMADKPAITALSSFKDVDKNAWYAEPIAWAQDNKIVTGYSDDKFGPNDPITREQIAAILWRNEKEPTGAGANMDRFSDTDKISTYAESAMQWAVAEGILNGDKGRLKPGDSATRAEFACMIMRFLGGSYLCESMKDWDEEELDVEGTYRLSCINGKSVKKYLLEKLGDEESVADYLELYELDSFDAMFVLTLKPDEKLVASYMGDDYTGTWKLNGNDLRLSLEGEDGKEDFELTCTAKEDEITVMIDGEEWLLLK